MEVEIFVNLIDVSLQNKSFHFSFSFYVDVCTGIMLPNNSHHKMLISLFMLNNEELFFLYKLLIYSVIKFAVMFFNDIFKKGQEDCPLPDVWCFLNFNTFPHTDAFWRLCSRPLWKTLWQKEKLLMMSNFSLCHNVFNSSNITLSFTDVFLIVAKMFQMSSAADSFYVGKGWKSLIWFSR